MEVTVVGALNWDVNIFVKHLPKPGEEEVASKIERGPGGKGGNVAVAAARILGPKKTALISSLGKDEPGKKQLVFLHEDGVETRGIKIIGNIESGQAFVTIDEQGNNVILTHFGANVHLTEEHIMEQEVQELLGQSKLIVVISPPRRVVSRILSEAKRLRKILMWHPGVLTRFGVEEWTTELKDLDYLILNEHEAMTFTKTQNPEEAVAKIQNITRPTKIIVTLGKNGAVCYSGKKITRVEAVSLEKMDLSVANTAGCGDAFVGAFSAYKTLGMTDEEALRYANMAGALKATRVETRGSPTRNVLESAYKKYYF